MHGEPRPQGRAPFVFQHAQIEKENDHALSRLSSVRAASEAISPLEKDQFLFKEFASLDDAFGWARHVNDSRPRDAR